MKLLIASVTIVIATLANSAQAANRSKNKDLGNLSCLVLAAKYDNVSSELPKVIESKEFEKSCALFADPEFGFGGACSFKAFNKLEVSVQATATDVEMEVGISKMNILARGDGGATLDIIDSNSNTTYMVMCTVHKK